MPKRACEKHRRTLTSERMDRRYKGLIGLEFEVDEAGGREIVRLLHFSYGPRTFRRPPPRDLNAVYYLWSPRY